MNSKKLRRKVQ